MERELPGIIEAKTRIPPARDGMLERTEILDSLAASRASVVLVQAPAGFGKTTVLEQWARRGDRRFAWVSLDPSEEDPTLFWRHMYAALRVGIPGFASHLHDEMAKPGPDLAGSVIPGILNDLATIDGPLVIVLDDYHRVRASEVDRTVQLFIRHLPRGITLAIGTRSRPRLPVSRLRSRGLILELDASELRLTLEDAGAVLRNQNPHRTVDEVSWIHEKAEGWPAGVYLFGLHESIDTSVRTTSDIRDYLMTEMLSNLSHDDLRFMRETSILSHLEAGACEYVTSEGSGQERLRRLADSNLLIVPLDNVGNRFRYHHLLQAELASRLEHEESSEDVAALHRRAMKWTAKTGDISEAIHHAVRAGDIEQAAGLVAEHWYEYIVSGRGQTAYLWLSEFSAPDLQANPILMLAGAMLAAFAGHVREARDFTAWAEAIPPGSKGLPGAASFESSVAFVRAVIAAGGPVSALADARRAAEIEPVHSPYRPLLAAMIGTFIYSTTLKNADSYPLLMEGSRALTGPPEVAAYALANLALLHAWRNLEDAALSHALDAIQRIDETNVGGLLTFGLPYAIAARLTLPRDGEAECRRLLKHAEQAERTASDAAPFDSMVLRTTMAEAFVAMDEFGLARTYAERALGNLAVMTEGGLVATRLDKVIRTINKTDPDPDGHSGPTGSLLSPREVQILSLLTTDDTLEGIGRRLYVSRNTVKTHTTRIYRKLGVSDRNQAVAAARSLGLL